MSSNSADPASWFPAVPAYEPPRDVSHLNRVQWALTPRRAALLVHDMQNFWLARLARPAPLIARVASLISAARTAGVPVLYSAAEPAGGLAERGLALERWGLGIGAGGPGAQEIAARVAPRPHDLIIRKPRYSAFFQTGLDRALDAANCSQIVIAGLFAHHGCQATAMDAYMRDIQAFLVADATADHSYDAHLAALSYVGEVCGCVITADEVEAAFERQAHGRPNQSG